jgi:hypothetical protein
VLAHVVRGQDLASHRLVCYPSRGVYGLPTQVAIPLGDMAGVDANTDIDGTLRVGGVVFLHCAPNAGGRTDGRHSGREGDEEPVAQ